MRLPTRLPPTPRRDAVRAVRAAVVVLVAVLLVSCVSRTRAPIDDRTAKPIPPVPPSSIGSPQAPPDIEAKPPSYTVKRGDTLYQIALDHGLDYRDLAAWNALADPNKISVGQVLRVTAPGDTAAASAASGTGVTTTPLKTVPPVTAAGAAAGSPQPAAAAPAARNPDNYKSSPKAVKEPYSEQAMREVARSAQAPPEVVATAPAAVAPPRATPPPAFEADEEDKLDWVWPAKGKVVVTFSETANLKGIDIAGAAGEPVIASAAGKVVYVGNGLRGYGKLVIVKHNKTWLSAYAHNREILVKEGQQVTKGQKIAEMGNTDADMVKLHFEIRRLGKPVDPARYLPVS